MEKYFLSVDGGGSKTEFCISDQRGNILFSVLEGPTNHKAVGKSIALENLQGGISTLEKKGVSKEEIAYSIWGLSGHDTPNDEEIQRKMIEDLGFKKEKFFLCNDALLAFYAQGKPPGMVLVAGTGAIALSIDLNGKIKRAGGWGYCFSDLGAGQWIGNEILKETLLFCDNCRDYDSIFENVKEFFNVKDFNQLKFYASDITSASEVAKLAPIVLGNYKSPLAISIIDRASTLLSILAISLYRGLKIEQVEDFKIILSGGIFKDELFYNELVEKLLREIKIPKKQIQLLKNKPVEGGINIIKNLKFK